MFVNYTLAIFIDVNCFFFIDLCFFNSARYPKLERNLLVELHYICASRYYCNSAVFKIYLEQKTDTVRLLFQINRKIVNTIWFRFDLIIFFCAWTPVCKKYFENIFFSQKKNLIENIYQELRRRAEFPSACCTSATERSRSSHLMRRRRLMQ